MGVTMTKSGQNRRKKRTLCVEVVESRLLMTASATTVQSILYSPPGIALVRPNTPVVPYGVATSAVSFVDPSVGVSHGAHVVIGQRDYVGPFARLDARSGYIKVGNLSTILDNASIIANPTGKGSSGVVIGQSTLIGYRATVLGPARIGAFGASVQVTSIGAGALIDGGNVEQGAIVGPLARVGPGVTIPSGMRVLPGKNVTTQAEASNPALGMVVAVTASDLTPIGTTLVNSATLAAGYTSVYQGSTGTGTPPGYDAGSGVPVPNNGNLSLILGSGPEPGTTVVAFEPVRQSPRFAASTTQPFQGQFHQSPFRATGQVVFGQTAKQVAAAVGHHNAIRGDQGQPIRIASIKKTGNGVTITSPVGGQVAIGLNFQAGNGSVILGGTSGTSTIGDNVTIGSGAVVAGSSLGLGTTVGDRAYVANSTLAPGTIVPAGAIMINNVKQGSIQW